MIDYGRCPECKHKLSKYKISENDNGELELFSEIVETRKGKDNEIVSVRDKLFCENCDYETVEGWIYGE